MRELDKNTQNWVRHKHTTANIDLSTCIVQRQSNWLFLRFFAAGSKHRLRRIRILCAKCNASRKQEYYELRGLIPRFLVGINQSKESLLWSET